jgi:NAD(P)H-flavin reductase
VSLVLRVKGAIRETPSTRLVRVDLDGAAFPFDAGQAALLAPAGAVERVPYSIACAPDDVRATGALEFLIKIDGEGTWGNDFPPLRRGMRLDVEGPVGTFAFPRRLREPRLLFIAGGTGIAPVRAMIRHARSIGYDGRVWLLYSARTPSDFAFQRELRGMARRRELDLVLTATREFAGRWRGNRGRMAADLLAPVVSAAPARCFVCGPSAMVADVPPILRGLGVPDGRIHVEQWT